MAEINNEDSNTLLSGTTDDDYIKNGGEWNYRSHDGGSNVTIDGGKGNDQVTLGSSNTYLYAKGDGNDIIEGFNDTSTLQITSGNAEFAYNDGVDTFLKIGEGIITLKGNKSTRTINIIDADGNSDTLHVRNPILNYKSNVSVFGSPSDDIIINRTEYPSTEKHTVTDTISVEEPIYETQKQARTKYETVGYEDVEEIEYEPYEYNVKKSRPRSSWTTDYWGTGSGSIDYYDEYYTSTRTGYRPVTKTKREPIIKESTEYVDVQVQVGTQWVKKTISREIEVPITVQTNNNSSTIEGGAGNDYIVNEAANFLYRYYDGDDTIVGFNADSTLQIGNENYSSAKSGADIIVKADNGSITLVDAADLNNVNILLQQIDDNADDAADDYFDDAADDYFDDADDYFDDAADDYFDDAADDYFDDAADDYFDDADDYFDDADDYFDDAADDYADDAADDYADDAADDFADDALSIFTIDKFVKPSVILDPHFRFADASKHKKAVHITGNGFYNHLIGGKKNDTLYGAGGNNTLTGGKGKNIFFYSGGKGVITDYNKKDKIDTGELAYEDFAFDGKDLIFNFGEENSLTIQHGADKLINLNSNANFYTADGIIDKKKKSIELLATTEKFIADSKVETIDGSATGAIEIVGNKKKNYILAGGNGATLNGGKGNDTLQGGTGKDLFTYDNKSGKDVIANFSAGDSISLNGVEIKDAKTKRGNTVLKFKGGALTVNGTTEFSFTQDGAEKKFSAGVFVEEDTAKIYGSFKGEINLADYAVKNFDASEAKKKLTITGDDSANSIQGGKKNDTLWGGAGNDTFIFQAGGGKDLIADYESGELLQILDKKGAAGTFTKATFKDDTLTFSVNGGGKVLVSGVGSDTSININGTSQKVSDWIK